MKIFLIFFLFVFFNQAYAEYISPGFYLVEGSKKCQKEFGHMIYMNSEKIIVSENCSFIFQNNDIRSVGICTRILSHRGDARYYPANTMGAFESALGQGFKGIELDVWPTSDNKLMVSHDNNLNAGSNCKGEIALKTAAEIISNCSATHSAVIPEHRLLSKKAKVNSPIPTLKEVLAKLGTDKRAEQIVIDIKSYPGGTKLIESFKEAFPNCSGDECLAIQNKITFITQSADDAQLIKSAYPYAHIAIESNKTVSGLIDTPNADLWNESCGHDTLSLSFNSLYDFRLKLVKFILAQDLHPKKRFKKLYRKNLRQDNAKRILGWTIQNKHGVLGLKKFNIQDVLTDLPYADVMNILLADTTAYKLERNLEKIKDGIKFRCEEDD